MLTLRNIAYYHNEKENIVAFMVSLKFIKKKSVMNLKELYLHNLFKHIRNEKKACVSISGMCSEMIRLNTLIMKIVKVLVILSN